jgi:hypothetical protein
MRNCARYYVADAGSCLFRVHATSSVFLPASKQLVHVTAERAVEPEFDFGPRAVLSVSEPERCSKGAMLGVWRRDF